MLCLTGKNLSFIQESCPKEILSQIVKGVTVFARTSPAQKDLIVRILNLLGLTTVMCGDGTNDVGSLKSATIGIAILNNKSPKE